MCADVRAHMHACVQTARLFHYFFSFVGFRSLSLRISSRLFPPRTQVATHCHALYGNNVSGFLKEVEMGEGDKASIGGQRNKKVLQLTVSFWPDCPPLPEHSSFSSSASFSSPSLSSYSNAKERKPQQLIITAGDEQKGKLLTLAQLPHPQYISLSPPCAISPLSSSSSTSFSSTASTLSESLESLNISNTHQQSPLQSQHPPLPFDPSCISLPKLLFQAMNRSKSVFFSSASCETLLLFVGRPSPDVFPLLCT